MTTYEWIATALVPVSSVVSWAAGARMRRNDTIKAMQTTIDMLAERNSKLYDENQQLKKEVTDLRIDGIRRDNEIESLKAEIKLLKK